MESDVLRILIQAHLLAVRDKMDSAEYDKRYLVPTDVIVVKILPDSVDAVVEEDLKANVGVTCSSCAKAYD